MKAEGKERSAQGENLKMSIEFPAGEGKLLPPTSLPLPRPLRTTIAKGFKDICEGGPSQQSRAARGQRPESKVLGHACSEPQWGLLSEAGQMAEQEGSVHGTQQMARFGEGGHPTLSLLLEQVVRQRDLSLGQAEVAMWPLLLYYTM